MRQQDGGPVQMEAAFTALRNGQVLQDLGLQGGPESFGLLDALVLRRRLQFGKGRDAEILVETQHLLGAETGHGEQLEHALRNVLAQFFKAGMRARLVQLGDDVGDRLTDARNLGKPFFGDEDMKRDGKGRQAICCPRVGFARYGLSPRKALRCAYSRRRLATARVSRAGTQRASRPMSCDPGEVTRR